MRGPDATDRVIVLGDTGSGKSQFAIALLSTRDWHKRPWFILDYKGEDLLEDILYETGSDRFGANGPIHYVRVTDDPPKRPGLYYVKVRPLVDDVAIEIFLHKIYDRASRVRNRVGSGIYLDEGYALPRNSKFFDVLLTQGRTLKCPIICLYQRPVEMSRFAVSQSTFRAVLRLGDSRDQETASRFIKPAEGINNEIISVFSPLPKYHCLWYDVKEGISTILAPAPPREAIIDTFISRLQPTQRKALV